MQLKTFLKTLALSLILLSPAFADVIVGKLTLSNAWVRAGTMDRNTAAYVTINNPSLTKDKLRSVTCQATKFTELHDHINENGVMRMRPVEAIAIGGSTVELKSGSLHIMLMGLKRDLKDGQIVTMTLEFEKAGKVDVDFAVVDPTKKAS